MTRVSSEPSGTDFFEIRFESIGGLGTHVPVGNVVLSIGNKPNPLLLIQRAH